MTLPQIVRSLMYGEDLAGKVELLRADRRKAIDYLVSVLEGKTTYELPDGVDPRDDHVNLLAALAALGKDDVEYLVNLLRSALAFEATEPAVSLTWVLAHLGKRAAVGVLMEAVAHRNPFVRWAACIGLHRYRARRARPLLNAAAADRDSLVRGAAVDALKQLGDKSSLPVLQKRLRDRYPGIRLAAQQAIDAINRRTSRRSASRGQRRR